MSKWLNLSQYIVYSNIWVAICVTSLTVQSYYLFNLGPIDQYVTGFSFFATLTAYNFQRIFRLNIPEKNELSHRMQWMIKHKTWLRNMTIVCFIFTAYFSVYILSKTWPILTLAAFISLFYSSNFVFKGRKLNLRNINFIKIFLISSVWTLITLWIPIYWSGIETKFDFVLSETLIRFSFILAITIPFDIRDIRYDQKDQLKTLVTWLGVKRSKQLAMSFLFLAMFLCAYNFLNKYYSFAWLMAVLVSFVVSAFVINRSGHDKKELFYTGLVESTILLFALLTISFYC